MAAHTAPWDASPPSWPWDRATAAYNIPDLIYTMGQQSLCLVWVPHRGEEEKEGQGLLQQPSSTTATPARHSEVPRGPQAEGWSLHHPLIILRINSSVSSPSGCAEQQLRVKKGTSHQD